MVRGLYTGWTGMATEQKRLDVIANNLANAATVGYKKEGVTTQSFDEALTIKIKDQSEPLQERTIGNMSLGVKIGEVYTDYGTGSFRETGNPFDLAIDGDGFFQVAVTDSNGETHMRYTRAGGFHMTSDGYIVDTQGNHLQSESGDLIVPTDAGDISIDDNGWVFADNEKVDRIITYDFEDYDYLKKYGETMYAPVDGATTIEAKNIIRSGWAEQSNVNVVSEMINMITITRAYEANQKIIKSIDQTLDLATNSVGRV